MQDGKDKNTETKKYKEQEEPNKSAKKADGEKVSEGIKASESLKTEKYDAATGKTDGAKKSSVETGSNYSYRFEAASGSEQASGKKENTGAGSSAAENKAGSNEKSSGGAAVKTKKSGDGTVKALAWTLIVLAAIIVLIIVLSNMGTSKGIIKGAKSYRYGESNSVNLNLEDYRYRKGDTIVWKIDDKDVQKKDASDKSALVLNTSSVGVGTHKVKAFLDGKEIAEFSMTVNKPLLKIKANDTSVVYGEEIPAPTYTIDGLVDGDTADSLGLVSLAESKVKAGDDAGDYEISFREFESEKYDVEVTAGTVKILPRELTFDISNKLVKEYDGTDTVVLTDIPLQGSVNGDVLKLDATARFSDKNAGENKSITLENVSIKGSNSQNYSLRETKLCGDITPKKVVLKEVVANDKIFDGTTTVTFSQVGRPEGIVETDAVAVGEITAAFVGAKPGNDVKVEIYNVTLIGSDSKNYQVEVDCDVKADILSVEGGAAQARKISGGVGNKSSEARRQEIA